MNSSDFGHLRRLFGVGRVHHDEVVALLCQRTMRPYEVEFLADRGDWPRAFDVAVDLLDHLAVIEAAHGTRSTFETEFTECARRGGGNFCARECDHDMPDGLEDTEAQFVLAAFHGGLLLKSVACRLRANVVPAASRAETPPYRAESDTGTAFAEADTRAPDVASRQTGPRSGRLNPGDCMNTTNRKTTSSRSRAPDAVKLLTADHKEVHALFQKYKKMSAAEAPAEEREALALQICDMVTVHATIEEEIFYSAARQSGVKSDLLDEAEVEHACAKDLIEQIRSMNADDELFDAKLIVLGEYIDHHVKEEQDEIFPACKKAKMDLQALGAELAERKSALMLELTSEPA
jgi:Hemerythrin HHE cation binding domain